MTPVPSTVRTAVEADRKEIWRLFLQGHKENGLFELAPEKVDWWITRMLQPDSIPEWDTGPRGTIGVIGPIGNLEGLVFLTIGGFWYSSTRHLEEMIVYVDPECRKSGHSKALIEWMKQQSVDTGLPLLTGIISNTRTEAKCRLYGRLLPKVGEFFFFNGKGSVLGSSAIIA
jgi:GNAT superfamily N-acetyltransferase